jgi:hypothetical protein
MNTYCAPALGARPSRFFISDKFPYPILTYIFQIFKHAHIVLGSVSFIQMSQIGAGEIFAFKTIFCFPVLKNITILYFAHDACNRFVDIYLAASGAFISFSQVGGANSAVHSAWSNERCFHFRFHTIRFDPALVVLMSSHSQMACILTQLLITPFNLKFVTRNP